MRLLRFLFRNWLLKIGAVGLAVILYGGMVFLQSTTVWPGSVAITPVNQPPDSTITGTLPSVTNIRYVAPPDVPLSVNTFSATIDLANAKANESSPLLVNVSLTAEDPRVQIIDYRPKQINVTLDPIITNTVPIQVSTGAVPSDVSPGTPELSVQTATVRGAASFVRQVAYAKASVRIDSSGLDVNQDVELVASTAGGAPVNNVTLSPRSVHVAIQVGSQIRTQTVPVKPVIVNAPASGYFVTGIDVTPPVVEVAGQADALAKINGLADTKPISIAGATGDVSASVDLDLPAGVTATSGTRIQVVVHLKSPDSTRTVTVGVIPSGMQAQFIYSYSTTNVIVTIGGPSAVLNSFDTSTLTAGLPVGSLGPGTFPVNVTISLPQGIKLISGGINPPRVTVTVTTPPTPAPTPTPAPATAAPTPRAS